MDVDDGESFASLRKGAGHGALRERPREPGEGTTVRGKVRRTARGTPLGAASESGTAPAARARLRSVVWYFVAPALPVYHLVDSPTDLFDPNPTRVLCPLGERDLRGTNRVFRPRRHFAPLDSVTFMSDKAVEVISWDPEDHVDVPGFAHGLTRYGGHWFDVGISVVPRDVDPLEALDKVFAKLREIVVSEHPTISYFTVDLRVASDSVVPHPR